MPKSIKIPSFIVQRTWHKPEPRYLILELIDEPVIGVTATAVGQALKTAERAVFMRNRLNIDGGLTRDLGEQQIRQINGEEIQALMKIAIAQIRDERGIGSWLHDYEVLRFTPEPGVTINVRGVTSTRAPEIEYIGPLGGYTSSYNGTETSPGWPEKVV